MIATRCRAALVAAVALLFTLIAYNNIVDYGSNFEFVRHVLLMDTVFPDSALRGRAIVSPAVHHAAYALIIAVELAVALVCWWGAAALACAAQPPGEAYRRARGVALAGLTLGWLLFVVGFLAVGGEWFAMWQSSQWNGQAAAFRMATVIGIVLLLLAIDERA